MKKQLSILVAAIAALASCNNEDPLSTQSAQSEGTPITFHSFVNKNTRNLTQDITAQNLSSFKVYGFMRNSRMQILDNELVTRNGTSWSYNNTQF